MATLFTWNDGTLPTTGGTGSVTSDGTTGSPTAPSLEIATATSVQAYAAFTLSSPTQVAARWHFRTPSAWPSTATVVAGFGTSAFTCAMQFAPNSAAGAVRLLRSGGAQVTTSANGVLSTSTWYRAELHLDTTAPGGGSGRARLYVFAIGSTTALYDSNWQSHTNYVTAPTFFRVGVLANQTINYRVDSIFGVDSVASVIGEAPSDAPPAAVAEASRRYTHPGNVITLDGTGSSDDVGISSYAWTQLSGTSVSLSDASTNAATFTAPSTLGDLTFRLTVTDTNAATHTDDVTVTVVPFGTVTILGDSLTERETDVAAPPDREAETRAVLEGANWDSSDIYWYGKGGKRMLAADVLGRDTLTDLTLADTALGELTQVVIALGTNDFLMSDTDFGDAIDDILDQADALDVQDLVWVNFAYKNPANIAVPPKNTILATKIAARSFARVADWWTYIHNPNDPADWLATSDDVHMSAQGYVKRDAFILDQLGGPGTPSGTSGPEVFVWSGSVETPSVSVTRWNGTTEDAIDSLGISV